MTSSPSSANYQAYSLATRTVAKTRQIVMLYDGAIRFLKQAKEAITEYRIEDRFNKLHRASEIMSGLQGSIDFINGGEIAHILDRFYSNMEMRITAVNFTSNGVELCDGIIAEIKQMRDTWDEIDRNLSKEPATSSVTELPKDADGSVAISA